MKKIRLYAASVLIGLPLLLTAASSYWVIRDGHQSPCADGKIGFHEAGYANLSLGVLGLFVICFPFQHRRRWAWFAMLSLEILYIVPCWVLPFSGAYAEPLAFIANLRQGSMYRLAAWIAVTALSVLVGLALSFRDFFFVAEGSD